MTAYYGDDPVIPQPRRKETPMKLVNRRLIALTALASGTLLASSCAVSDAVIQTIRLAFGIVDVWV